MKDPKITVVKITQAKVVVTTTPRSLKWRESVAGTSGILSTRAKAIAPLIIPPYVMKSNSLNVTSGVLEHAVTRPWAVHTAMTLPTIMMAHITTQKVMDQGYLSSS